MHEVHDPQMAPINLLTSALNIVKRLHKGVAGPLELNVCVLKQMGGTVRWKVQQAEGVSIWSSDC